jgi:iron(III) transport system substrate-binding protein
MTPRSLLVAVLGLGLMVGGFWLPGAQAAGKVVIYNADTAEFGEAFAQAFNKQQPDVHVEIISAGVGQLFTRVKAEAARPQGDIMLAASHESFLQMADLFQAYTTKFDRDFASNLKDVQRRFYGFSMPLQVLIVNTSLVPPAEAPKAWKDLGDPKWKGKIIMANPALSGSAYAQLAQMVQLHGWPLIQQVVKNATITSSSKLAYQSVGTGEFVIGLTGEENVFKMKEEGRPVEAVHPAEGTGLRFDAVGIIKGGPNLDNAKLFQDFTTSKEAHSLAAGKPFFRRSVRKDVAPPPGLKPTAEIKFFDYDVEKAAKEKGANLKQFDEIMAAK